MALAIFGISNDGLNLAVTLFVLMVVVVWLALIVYTYLDARRRISDPFLVACATIGSFFPYIGTAVYAIVRPPEFLEDAHERELEIRAAELRVRQLTESSCPNCEFPVERSYMRCPQCQKRLKDPCKSCGKPVDPRPSARARSPSARAAAGRRPRAAPSARDAPSARPPRRPRRSVRAGPSRRPSPSRPPRPAATQRSRRQNDPKGAPIVSRTLILVKPDAFERALTGEVIARFERKGLRIAALKTMRADEPIANKHYEEHTDKPFFGELVSFITGGTLVAMVLEGTEAVAAARQLIGATNPVEAAPGSIRGEFALEVTFNMVHGSDSDESAEREIGIWFPELS
jgi:nucleoside-diphosphate kinase